MKPDPSSAVQVLYALPDEQTIVAVPHEPGMTAALAAERSGLLAAHPEIKEDELVLGVWGVEVDPAYPVKGGDRVEISRPLIADPREMRRELISHGRVMGGAEARKGRIRKSDPE